MDYSSKNQSTLERAHQAPPPPPKQQPRSDANMTIEEVRLINYCRELGWGKIEVMVKSGKPVMIQVERRDIKLTD